LEAVQLKEFPEIKEFYQKYGTKFFNDIEKYTGVQIPRDDAVLAIIILGRIYDTLFVQVLILLQLCIVEEGNIADTLHSF
jgi:hypothetical protein